MKMKDAHMNSLIKESCDSLETLKLFPPPPFLTFFFTNLLRIIQTFLSYIMNKQTFLSYIMNKQRNPINWLKSRKQIFR